MIATEESGAGTVLVRYGAEIGRIEGGEVRFSMNGPKFTERELREIADILKYRRTGL